MNSFIVPLAVLLLAGSPVADGAQCQPLTQLTQPVGEIVNNNESYSNKLACTWTIKPECPTPCAIVATFDQIALEAGYDFVTIYDGDAKDETMQIGRYTGYLPPEDIIAMSGVMTVEFTSDDDTADQGWKLHYHSEPKESIQTRAPTAVTPPSDQCKGDTTLHSLSGTITEGQGAYESSLECSWLIMPERLGTTIQHIEVTFDAFQIEADFDFVTIYDGATTEAPLLGKFSGNALPPKQTSTGSALLLVFSTDHSGVGEGFVAHWTSVTQGGETGHITACPSWECADVDAVPGDICTDGATYVCCDQAHNQCEMPPCWFPDECPAATLPGDGRVTPSPKMDATGAEPCLGQKLLTGEHGALSEGPGQYGHNSDCEWLIDPQCNGQCGVVLNFTRFALETGYDFVTIYDGAEKDETLQIGRYTGYTVPQGITAPSGKMLIAFQSDQDTADDGFNATYSVFHGAMTIAPTQSGSCSSSTELKAMSGTLQDGNGNYANGASCNWLIRPDPPLTVGQFVVLQFDTFSTEQYYDIVTIYDGSQPSDPVIGRFSGSTIPPMLSASSGAMLVVFAADNTEVKDGFTAHYTVSSSAAPTMPPTQPMSAELAYIQQQGHMAGMQMPYPAWLAIQAEFGPKLQQGALVSGEVVPVQPADACADLTNPAALAGKIALVNRGTCTFVSKTQRCQDAGALMVVIINVNGSALIMGGISENLRIPALSVSLTTGQEIHTQLDATNNHLMIDTLLHEVTDSPGGMPTPPVPAPTVAPNSGSTSDGQCQGVNLLTEGQGTFSEGPGRYGNNAKCEWLIRPPCPNPPCQISLHFSKFALEAGYDFVTVYKGASTNAEVLKRLTGPTQPPPPDWVLPSVVVAGEDAILVEFTTDSGTTDDGFEATYTSQHSTQPVATQPPSAFVGECSGQMELTDEQGIFSEAPGKYPDGATCSWLIKPRTASTEHLYVVLQFDKFTTEKDYDFVTIYDGEDTSAPKIGTFSGANIPRSVSSSRGAMLVVFTSDNSGSDEGFTAHWSTSSTAAPTHPPTAPVSAEVVHLTQTKPAGPDGFAPSWLALISAFGPRVKAAGISGKVVMANPINACGDLHNTNDLKNNIVLVHRGLCTFVEKVQRCQQAFAKAVLVVNIQGSGDPLIMAGDGLGILIPSFSLSSTVGDEIMQSIGHGSQGIELSISSGRNPVAPSAAPLSPASSSSAHEISPGSPVVAKLTPRVPRTYRVLVLHSSRLKIKVERIDQQDALLRVYVNLGSAASPNEWVASNAGQPSNADEFDVMVDQPLDGRFYYVQIQSEKQEMVRISAELVADLASSLSPVGAVFVSVGIIIVIGLSVFATLTYKKRQQRKKGFVELREIDPGAPFVVGQVVN